MNAVVVVVSRNDCDFFGVSWRLLLMMILGHNKLLLLLLPPLRCYYHSVAATEATTSQSSSATTTTPLSYDGHWNENPFALSCFAFWGVQENKALGLSCLLGALSIYLSRCISLYSRVFQRRQNTAERLLLLPHQKQRK